MKIAKKKVRRFLYSKEDLAAALRAVKNGYSITAASMKYKIPRSTLADKMMRGDPFKKPGPECILTAVHEDIVEQWILNSGIVGFPVTKMQLLNSVQLLVQQLKIDNPFLNDRPGRKWYESFLQRHPSLAVRLDENSTISRGIPTEESIKNWYEQVELYLKENNLVTINSNQVFACNEICLTLNPQCDMQGSAKKESKNAHNLINKTFTALISGNAAGQVAPALLMLSQMQQSKLIFKKMPEGWSFGETDDSSTTAQGFHEWLTNSFHSWIEQENIQKPVILFVDGQASFLTMFTSEFCSKNQIILISLPANTTHITQPMDVSMFPPLKSLWERETVQYKLEKNVTSVSNPDIAPLLEKVLRKMDSESLLNCGFRECGLHPFNMQAIDYNKLERRGSSISNKLGAQNPSDYSIALKVLNEYLSPSAKSIFELSIKTQKWLGRDKDECLFNFWKELSSQVGNTNNFTQEEEMDIKPSVFFQECLEDL